MLERMQPGGAAAGVMMELLGTIAEADTHAPEYPFAARAARLAAGADGLFNAGSIGGVSAKRMWPAAPRGKGKSSSAPSPSTSHSGTSSSSASGTAAARLRHKSAGGDGGVGAAAGGGSGEGGLEEGTQASPTTAATGAGGVHDDSDSDDDDEEEEEEDEDVVTAGRLASATRALGLYRAAVETLVRDMRTGGMRV